ncbi:hypothetical protein BVH01_05000 [Pseudomonas sp. PA1(2017)]|nr:hypothetical protein BVH01_05000 [Pseudomonas sp. PA1(2017)]
MSDLFEHHTISKLLLLLNYTHDHIVAALLQWFLTYSSKYLLMTLDRNCVAWNCLPCTNQSNSSQLGMIAAEFKIITWLLYYFIFTRNLNRPLAHSKVISKRLASIFYWKIQPRII